MRDKEYHIAFTNFLSTYVALDEDAIGRIHSLLQVEVLSKGHEILSSGKRMDRVYYLHSGGVRTFFYHEGKDVTHWIYESGSMFTSWYAYLNEASSDESIETTTESVVVSMTKNQWEELYQAHPVLERFGRKAIEEQIGLIDAFYKGYYFMSAKEKYQLLLQYYPNIEQVANLGHVASMLGISQETLSRVRRSVLVK